MMSLTSRRLVQIAICSILIIAVSGCGRGGSTALAKAQGTVTFEGAPLAGCTVTFATASGQLATGTTDEKGEFTLKTGDRSGAPVGECKVSVTPPPNRVEFDNEKTKKLTSEDIYKMQHQNRTQPADAAAASNAAPAKPQIPAKYSNPERSGLTATVSTDTKKNVFDFKLTAM